MILQCKMGIVFI